MKALCIRLRNAVRYVLRGTSMPAQPVPQTRVGLLNTGELVLLCPRGEMLVLGAATTDLVRDVLGDDARAFGTLPLPEVSECDLDPAMQCGRCAAGVTS